MADGSWVRASEQPFVRRASDWVRQVEATYAPYLTDFLTPRERYLAESVARAAGLHVEAHGGFPEAERVRLLILPEPWPVRADDFEIQALQVVAQGGAFAHGDLLGSLLGLGLKRASLGDLALVSPAEAYVFVERPLTRYLMDSLSRVGRVPVRVREVAEVQHLPPPAYEPRDISVMSLRMDAIVAQACRLSRKDAQTLVASGRVELNHQEAEADAEVRPGDVLSVRGFGRVRVIETVGQSKRGRWIVRVGVLRSRPSSG
ncbi:YlmH/Sll1252 family protein [Alicyclobacillus vulcanalis]|uniref:RNA-binding protein YlmH, contains S4-like domain n=1 Tax=Alicyclobacillus vulcanalis TaxID=252246 RepID=A0A1N7NQ94_9BACL|nr:YlmH/Sll1252 family protein [Alicyclobacillus vulcanalis]SIT00481.1 RNA-binding protein YlmH, contains S4-like domain [Alicyclobacillus vulcanalis]